MTKWNVLINSRPLFQECPTGLVDEDSFKDIFAQFFPQGGKLFFVTLTVFKNNYLICYILVPV